ncbi:MAG: glutathione S-transferase [Porticoccaceae bacterium]|nr:glutathione S-transferase [Porticoccaceae bacterium]
MITIYHLGVSQSDRVVWLMEELALPYNLEWFDRQESGMAPPEYKALHPAGTAPIIRDGDLVLSESRAIVDYIINRHGNGRLQVGVDQPNYPDYLYWMSFRDSLQGNLMLQLFLKSARPDDPAVQRAGLFANDRVDRQYAQLEDRLGQSDYLAGPEFTAADLINFFAFTTMPLFGGPGVDKLPNLSRYVQRVSQRPSYIKSMAIAGPDAKRPA